MTDTEMLIREKTEPASGKEGRFAEAALDALAATAFSVAAVS